jgi:hypothetical protein
MPEPTRQQIHGHYEIKFETISYSRLDEDLQALIAAGSDFDIGPGLLLDSGVLLVDIGNGLEIVDNKITVKIGGSTGLEFAGDSLRVKLLDTSLQRQSGGMGVNLATNPGLEISSGLKLKLTDTSLALGSGGVGVNLASTPGLEISSGLRVKVDGSTIERHSDGAIRVKALGINDSHVAAANKDGNAGAYSLRTLGTGAQQAAAGNHHHNATYMAIDRFKFESFEGDDVETDFFLGYSVVGYPSTPKLLVWVNGLFQTRGEHWVLTTPDTVRFTFTPKTGDKINCYYEGE